MEPRPYHLCVGEPILQDLRMRLQRTRRLPGGAPSDWTRGVDPDYLDGLVGYWLDGFDWHLQEKRLNAQPQFKAHIGDDQIYFLHIKGRAAESMPLLLLHGWPDSFLRYSKVIPLLADPRRVGGRLDDAFNVVVPSLPGFPLSSPMRCPAGVPADRHTAQLLWRLMTESLGYDSFAVAGGDAGSVLAQILAISYPQSVVAIHLTDIGWPAADVDPSSLTRPEARFVSGLRKRFMADGAYAAVQRSQPRSLAVGLNDSPLGLACWIVDRLRSCSDERHDFKRSFSKDDLLTNIVLFWATQTIGSSLLSYHSEARSPALTPHSFVVKPVGLALFPFDGAGIPPRSFAERTLNVRRYTRMPRGGHFAALEEPALLARDLIEFFRPLRTWTRLLTRPVKHLATERYAPESR